jgi:hypothetical protein
MSFSWREEVYLGEDAVVKLELRATVNPKLSYIDEWEDYVARDLENTQIPIHITVGVLRSYMGMRIN